MVHLHKIRINKPFNLLITVFIAVLVIGIFLWYKYDWEQIFFASQPSILNNSIHINVPQGWNMKQDILMRRTVDDDNIAIGFQINDDDYMSPSGAYAKSNSEIQTVTTKRGTKLFVFKDTAYVYVSSCKPRENSACSIPFQGGNLFISMHMYREGDQYPRELNFSQAYVSDAIVDLVKIVESSDL